MLAFFFCWQNADYLPALEDFGDFNYPVVCVWGKERERILNSEQTFLCTVKSSAGHQTAVRHSFPVHECTLEPFHHRVRAQQCHSCFDAEILAVRGSLETSFSSLYVLSLPFSYPKVSTKKILWGLSPHTRRTSIPVLGGTTWLAGNGTFLEVAHWCDAMFPQRNLN